MKEEQGGRQVEDGSALAIKAQAATTAAPSKPSPKASTPVKDLRQEESPERRQGYPQSHVPSYRASPPHSRSFPHSSPPHHHYAAQVTPYSSAPPRAEVGPQRPYYASPPPPPRYGDYTGSPPMNLAYNRGPPPPGDPYFNHPPPPRMHHSRQHPPGVYAHEDVIPQSSGKLAGCTCKKSKCLKLYCQCFASSTTCGPKCKCGACHNTTMHAMEIENARQTILYRNSSAFDKKTVPQRMEWAPAGPPYPSRPLQHSLPPPPPPPHYYSALASNHAPLPPPHPRNTSNSNKYGCKCKRSFCLKKYCECFQNASSCGLHCKCTNCKNLEEGTLTGGMTPYYPPRPLPRHLQQQRAPPPPPPPPRPVVMERRVEVQETRETEPRQEELATSETKEPNDRMAMMAAVAMTELLAGSKETPKDEQKAAEDGQKTTEEVEVAAEKAKADAKEHKEDAKEDVPAKEHKAVSNNKRKAPKREEYTDETQPRVPLKKRKSFDQPPHRHPYEEREHGHVGASMSMESRNPSPVANLRGSPYGTPPSRSYSYESGGPPPMMMHPPPRHGPPEQYRASPPPRLAYRASPPPPYYAPPPPLHYHHPRASPPPPPPLYRASPTMYEEIIRTTGLPKSLSFRKICSKCGKTRAEHGELGFGNKCVFQDCGKCGAGVHMHQAAEEPMGILCQLTVEQGATPGKAVSYERKIRELAARADLQQQLRRKEAI